jgi:nitrogen fixation NifU-like protein
MDEHLKDLYQEIILSHNKRPRNEGELDPYTGRAEGFNPLCGDKVTVFVNERAGKIEAVKFVGEGCAISRASASIMTTLLADMTVEQAKARSHEFYQMLTSTEEPALDFLEQGEVAALAGVRQFPARIKCATLAWHALEEALGESPQRS